MVDKIMEKVKEEDNFEENEQLKKLFLTEVI